MRQFAPYINFFMISGSEEFIWYFEEFSNSYHAGFVCSYMLDGDIKNAMGRGSEIAANTLSHYGGF